MRLGFWFVFALGSSACASAPTPVAHSSGSGSPSADAHPRPPSIESLESLRAAVARSDAAVLDTLGIRLAHAGRAREMTGEAASDERVAQATLVTRDEAGGALVLTTSCGNAALLGVHWDGARWTTRQRIDLVSDLRPGQCAQSTVRGEALALSSDARREIAVVVASQDVTGADLRGPFLSVYQLGPDGTFRTLLHDAPFGSTDDATGATTVGSYAVIEDIPAPRPLHVSIRPGRQGPGGAPAAVNVNRTYVLRADHLELVNETTDAAE